jgi:hypothetical protein
MLIALLAVLGVDLIVVVALVGVVLSRRAWMRRRPGAFQAAVRVVEGDVAGFGPKWKRGVGRWVGAVLVWAKGPALFRYEMVEAERLDGELREAASGDAVKRLGNGPLIMAVATDSARIEIATAAEHRKRALGPFAASGIATSERLRQPSRLTMEATEGQEHSPAPG